MPASPIKTLLLAATVLGVLTPVLPAEAAFTQISASTLKFEGVRYWRKKASEAKLGAVGQKMTPMAGKNYFQKVQDAPNGIYEVSIDARTTITTEEAHEWGVTAAYSNVSGSAGGSGSYSGTLTAYKMRIDLGNSDGDMRYETNRHTSHLAAVKGEGDRARLVSAVWVLVQGSESKAECYSGELKVSNGTMSVGVSGSGCSNSAWTIEPGAIIAYEMVKVDQWNDKEITSKPTCGAAFPAYESRNSPITPKDRCKKTTYDTATTQCKLAITDNRDNWFVESKSGRDTCKSRKGKPDKDVECGQGGFDYVAQSGRDTCRKPEYTYADPVCPSGYTYEATSTSNGGVDRCNLRGVQSLEPDSQDGF